MCACYYEYEGGEINLQMLHTLTILTDDHNTTVGVQCPRTLQFLYTSLSSYTPLECQCVCHEWKIYKASLGHLCYMNLPLVLLLLHILSTGWIVIVSFAIIGEIQQIVSRFAPDTKESRSWAY